MWTLVIVGVLVALLIGFFVAARVYMAGLIGTSASPISGIGILATIISSLVVYFIASENNLFATEAGVTIRFTAMAIFMTSVVIAIASISNDNLQDLKTGQLVGATPWRQTNCVVTWLRSRCNCNCSCS